MKLELKYAARFVSTALPPEIIGKKLKHLCNFQEERVNRVIRFVVIARSYKQGMPVREISDKFKCTRSTILRYARLARLPKRPKHLPEDTKDAVMQDYEAGIPVATIALTHNVSESYVSKLATIEGVSRYKKHHRRNRP